MSRQGKDDRVRGDSLASKSPCQRLIALKTVKEKVESLETKREQNVRRFSEYWFSISFHKEVLSFTVSAQQRVCLLLMLYPR
jgi:ABC-type uncharacterized transport system ATPase subunit